MPMRISADWLLTPERVALHVPTATAVIADLHLGYGQARRRGGEAVPLVGLDDVLAPLGAVIVRHGVRRLAVAGDLFEEIYRPELVAELLSWLREARVELTGVVPGNHDRGIAGAVELPLFPEGFRLGSWRLVHGDRNLPGGRVVLGHWHPCLRWQSQTALPCYLARPARLVLPAYSPDAAGANVVGQQRWQRYRCYVIAGSAVIDLGEIPRQRAKAKRKKA